MKDALFIAAAIAALGTVALVTFNNYAITNHEAAARESAIEHCRSTAEVVAVYGRDQLPELARIADECRKTL